MRWHIEFTNGQEVDAPKYCRTIGSALAYASRQCSYPKNRVKLAELVRA